MSNLPFGFNPGPAGRRRRRRGHRPGGRRPAARPTPSRPCSAAAAATSARPSSGSGQLLSYQGGPVNWDLARDVARQTVSAAGDRSVTTAEREQVLDAMRLAELWLDEAMRLPGRRDGGRGLEPRRVGRGDAAGVARAGRPGRRQGRRLDGHDARRRGRPDGAARAAMPEQAASAMAGPLQQMMRSIGGAMFGTQIGQAIGALALEVVGSTDVGLPLTPGGTAALLPANVDRVRRGPRVPADQVRLYLALREAAHQRLFAHVPWLRAHLVDAVAAYARGINVDTARLEEAVGTHRPDQPRVAAGGADRRPVRAGGHPGAEGRAGPAGDRARAGRGLGRRGGRRGRQPRTCRPPPRCARRCAAAGPAAARREQTFASLVGLELRPRRLRDAAALWRAVLAERGQDGREAVWAHPDLLPTADDLDDPAGFASGASSAPLDLSGLDDTQAPPEPRPERVTATPARRRRRGCCTGWPAPDDEQERLRSAYLEHLRRPRRRAAAQLRARPPHGERAGPRPRRRCGCC